MKVSLEVTSNVASADATQLAAFKHLEATMKQQERLIKERDERRNALETYVYNTRDVLASEEYLPFMTEEAREKFMTQLEEMEEWLYTDEGFDSAKSVFVAKLTGLQNVGNPVFMRKTESEGRADAVAKLNKAIESYRTKVNSDQCAHLEEADTATVRNSCKAASEWITSKLEEQAKKKDYEDLVVTIADIASKEKQVHNECRKIVNKPKPKPVVEKPKEEEKKTEEADKPTAAEGGEEKKEGEGESTKKEEGEAKAAEPAAADESAPMDTTE